MSQREIISHHDFLLETFHLFYGKKKNSLFISMEGRERERRIENTCKQLITYLRRHPQI